MFVITGAQRSGTSFFAKWLHQCGMNLGTEFWDERVSGGFENPDACNFFRDLLGDNSFPFTKYWKLIAKERPYGFYSLHNLNPYVIKVSYLCMLPELVKAWYKCRGTRDTLIILNRNPEDVVASKERMGSVFLAEDYQPLIQSPAELTKNLEISEASLDKLGISYVIIDFPFKKEEVFTKLQQVGFTFPPTCDAGAVWDRLFDPSKIHEYNTK